MKRSIMTFSITILSIKTFSITILSIKAFDVTSVTTLGVTEK
jgi:hypothetical protein